MSLSLGIGLGLTMLNVNKGESSMILLSTKTASGDATLEFTELNSSVYNSYVLMLGNVTTNIDGELIARTSSNGGTSYDSGVSDYDRTGVYTLANNATALTANQVGVSEINLVWGQRIESTKDGFSGSICILNPHLAQETQMLFEGAYIGDSGFFSHQRGAGVRKSSANVNAIQISVAVAANMPSGTISLYGIK